MLHRLRSSGDAQVLPTIAGNPHLEHIFFSQRTHLSLSDLLPLIKALAQQPPDMPPLKIHAAFVPNRTCMADVVECCSVAGGRPLVMVHDFDAEKIGSDASEYSSDLEV
jgi:hypothetical protein